MKNGCFFIEKKGKNSRKTPKRVDKLPHWCYNTCINSSITFRRTKQQENRSSVVMDELLDDIPQSGKTKLENKISRTFLHTVPADFISDSFC